jgi:hypothetical protein
VSLERNEEDAQERNHRVLWTPMMVTRWSVSLDTNPDHRVLWKQPALETVETIGNHRRRARGKRVFERERAFEAFKCR